MTIPHTPRALPASRPQSGRLPARPADLSEADSRKSLVMRKFQIASLTPSGAIYGTDQVGPATAAFESAFSAFARGTQIKTTRGPVAVEDLQPGMEIQTSEHGPMPLLWIGTMTLMPDRGEMGAGGTRLTRIMADSLGLARPAVDLMAGPGARLLVRPTELHDIVGAERILIPARDLVDGVNIIDIAPPRPVSTYHLCLHRHATILAAGLEAESFHPGPGFERGMGQNMLSLFLSFFPHIHAPSDFGPLAHPRVSANGQSEVDLT